MPTESQPPPQDIQHFITRWEQSGSAERANCQIFLTELCALLGVPPPEPATPDTRRNTYVFERAVHFDHGDGAASTGRIDLYKRGCFVLEAKQGSDPLAAEKPLSTTVRDEQIRMLRTALATQPAPVTAEELARSFLRAQTNRVADFLETLTDLGQARKLDDGRYTAG